MALPMAIFSALRMVLYVVLFGHLAHWMSDIDGGEDEIDTVFWIILFFASWDMGPMILIAIDFWYQYGKMSPNGVLGTRENPLRCVVAQSVLMCIASWSLIAIVAEYDTVEDVWAWVIHGILSTAALVFAVFCNYSGTLFICILTQTHFQSIFVLFVPSLFGLYGFSSLYTFAFGCNDVCDCLCSLRSREGEHGELWMSPDDLGGVCGFGRTVAVDCVDLERDRGRIIWSCLLLFLLLLHGAEFAHSGGVCLVQGL